jgi:hypothetical protein
VLQQLFSWHSRALAPQWSRGSALQPQHPAKLGGSLQLTGTTAVQWGHWRGVFGSVASTASWLLLLLTKPTVVLQRSCKCLALHSQLPLTPQPPSAGAAMHCMLSWQNALGRQQLDTERWTHCRCGHNSPATMTRACQPCLPKHNMPLLACTQLHKARRWQHISQPLV